MLFPSIPEVLGVDAKVVPSFPWDHVEYRVKWECNSYRWKSRFNLAFLKKVHHHLERTEQAKHHKNEPHGIDSLQQVFQANAKQVTSLKLRKVVQHYLTHVMSVPEWLNTNRVLSLLHISATSFNSDGEYTSLKEDFFQVRSWIRRVHWKTPIIKESLSSVNINLDYSKKKLLLPKRWRWVVLKDSYLAIYDSPLHKDAVAIFLFDSSFQIERKKTTIIIMNSTYLMEFRANNETLARVWTDFLRGTIEGSTWHSYHRDQSFAPVRNSTTTDEENESLKCQARWFVDGKDTFAAIYKAISQAKHEILITDWWFTPEFFLIRPSTEHPESQLEVLLKKKAEEGVQIYVLIYKEIKFAIPNSSSHGAKAMKAIGENIHVLRDPDFEIKLMGLWTHHEKIVVLDQQTAFLGGFDLCFGRYDTPQHPLLDQEEPHIYPGKDYCNDRIQDNKHVDKPYVDSLDRSTQVRLPWHDVHCCVEGLPAFDVGRHFIQRWNFSLATRPYRTRKVPLLKPDAKVPDRNLHISSINRLKKTIASKSHGFCTLPNFFHFTHERKSERHSKETKSKNSDPTDSCIPCHCQIVRSVSYWSAGGMTEKSIQHSYIRLIDEAEHFIYIENQFFISGFQGDHQLKNRVVDAIYHRILRAASEKKKFRVIVFIPLLPGVAGRPNDRKASSLRGIMYWQYRTICRGGYSLYEKLYQEIENPFQYITFYGLRTHQFNNSQVPLTEEIYIHSKTMVVDDKKVIIGSANITDRSMNGDRDSEIAVVIEDKEMISSCLNEQETLVGKFTHTFRMKLWEEHFGLVHESNQYNEFKDPMKDSTWIQMQEIAMKNADIYHKVFACVPNDYVLSLQELASPKKHMTSICERFHNTTANKNEDFKDEETTTTSHLKKEEENASTPAPTQQTLDAQQTPDAQQIPASTPTSTPDSTPETPAPTPQTTSTRLKEGEGGNETEIEEDKELDAEIEEIGLEVDISSDDDNFYSSIEKYQERQSQQEEKEMEDVKMINMNDPETALQRSEELASIQGHAVYFPLNFLSKSSLKSKFIPKQLLQ